jgi:hypothetical protein
VKYSTKFCRNRSGKMVHLSGCPTVNTRTVMPWYWAENRDEEEIWIAGTEARCKFCKICDPCKASARLPLYDMDGKLITVDAAREMMLNFDIRRVSVTNLDFMGHDLVVITSFVPVDHGETHGTYTTTPSCWYTEILGGPPDIDGTTSHATSQDEAMSLHVDVVQLALASGCTLR